MNAFLFLQSLVLGTLQGLTEFLPISSSAHLVLTPWLLGWKDPGATFDVALHIGTFFALSIYFWKDWLSILINWKKPLFWLILAACIPAAFFGYRYEVYFETVFRNPAIIAALLIGMGLLMLASERWSEKKRTLDSLTLADALFIGFFQVLALMPGVSRSGITITAGLFAGFKREDSARFSFLLSMPIVAGAALLKTREIVKSGIPEADIIPFLIGIFFAVVTGVLTIKYLLKFLKNHSLKVFVWYRFLFGILILAFWFIRRSIG